MTLIYKTGSFPHDNFSSVYWIFTKLDHMIALWKGKNPIYFGIIRSKVKVTVTINDKYLKNKTKFIGRDPVGPPTRHTQSHSYLETGV
jgi:hypothetical protein